MTLPEHLKPYAVMLDDLRALCASDSHLLQAVNCVCGAAAWADVTKVSSATREACINCPCCGRGSTWRIRRRRKALDERFQLLESHGPSRFGVVAAALIKRVPVGVVHHYPVETDDDVGEDEDFD